MLATPNVPHALTERPHDKERERHAAPTVALAPRQQQQDATEQEIKQSKPPAKARSPKRVDRTPVPDACEATAAHARNSTQNSNSRAAVTGGLWQQCWVATARRAASESRMRREKTQKVCCIWRHIALGQNGEKVQGQNLSIVPAPSSCTSSSSSAPRDALERRRRRFLNSSPCQVPDAFAQKTKRNRALQAYGHTLPSGLPRHRRHCCSELVIRLC